MNWIHRRQFLKQFGLSASSLPFLLGLPSLGLAAPARPRQRLIVMFSPNGTIPPAFWPDEAGADFKLKEIMTPLEEFKGRMLFLHGLSNKVRGDGDGHMRGMSCLLTGIELFPGNIVSGKRSTSSQRRRRRGSLGEWQRPNPAAEGATRARNVKSFSPSTAAVV